MAGKLGVFLLTLLVCWAALAGMRRIYVAVASMPMERLIAAPVSQLPKTVKPILLPPEPQAPDFGYGDEALATTRRAPIPAKTNQTVQSRAIPAEAAAGAKEGAPAPRAASKPPPSQEPKSPEARLMGAGARAKSVLEEARRKAGKLQRIGFKEGETMMAGDSGSGSSQAEPERPKLRPSSAIQDEDGAQSEASSYSPTPTSNNTSQRSMRAVSYGGSSTGGRPAVQRPEEAPAVVAEPQHEEEGE